jgi:hypothetical protein
MLSGAFTDQGVTASDVDGDITSRVVVAGVAVKHSGNVCYYLQC